MAGLGRWWAQLPAVLFVTSPYLLTTTYVREFAYEKPVQ